MDEMTPDLGEVEDIRRRFLQPPVSLTKRQLEIWWIAVESYPTDWFLPVDATIVLQFVVLSDEFERQMRTPKSDGVDEWRRSLVALSRELRQVAEKMRACPSSRTSDHHADQAKRGAEDNPSAEEWQQSWLDQGVPGPKTPQ